MSRKIDLTEAANWSEDEAAANLAYIRDNLGDVRMLRVVLEARGMSWSDFMSTPEPELFPQPEGGDRGRQLAAPALEVVEAESSAVPDGTIDEVLDWVEEDPAKAALALEAERAGKNRKGLVEALESVMEEEG